MKNNFIIVGSNVEILVIKKDNSEQKVIIDFHSLKKLKGARVGTVKDGNNFYAFVSYGRGKRWLMHRYLMEAKDKEVIDHINHNTLDNRITNLRFITKSGNSQNRLGAQKNSLSGVRGVSWDKEKKKWVAYATINKVKKFIGRFDILSDADKAAKEYRQKYMEFLSAD